MFESKISYYTSLYLINEDTRPTCGGSFSQQAVSRVCLSNKVLFIKGRVTNLPCQNKERSLFSILSSVMETQLLRQLFKY